MSILRALLAVSLLTAATLAACADQPSLSDPPFEEPTPKPVPTPLGVYEVTIHDVDGSGRQGPSPSVLPVPTGPAEALNPLTAGGLVFEAVSTSSYIEGTRSTGGQRFIIATFRVRNSTGAPLTNLTAIPAIRPSTIPGTPFTSLLRFDGTAVPAAVATQLVPTGAVYLGDDLELRGAYPDVLQVFTEAEIAAITLPAGTTSLFPYGFVVRNPSSAVNRTLPVAASANEFAGAVTFAFRYPLQATAAGDPYSISFQFLAVEDTETRLTESIEEAHDTSAVRRVRDRATAIGATTVTVLNGSTAMDAAIPDYPGQRQICSVRTAGPPGSPTTFITNPSSYTRILVLTQTQAVDSCAAYFSTGTPSRPATNVVFNLDLYAMDRYGNRKLTVVDTVQIVNVSGPPMLIGPAGAMTSGLVTIGVTYTDYGSSLVKGAGRRNQGRRDIPVAGVTRTWTSGAGTTDWNTNGNWSPAAVPMSLDSVHIPVAAPLDPVLASNVSIQGVTVEDVAILAINAFNLTANGNVTTGLTGGITNTSGQLVLAGTARTVQGRLPRIRATGTYSLTGNVTARAPLQTDAGRITSGAFRLQADSN